MSIKVLNYCTVIEMCVLSEEYINRSFHLLNIIHDKNQLYLSDYLFIFHYHVFFLLIAYYDLSLF